MGTPRSILLIRISFWLLLWARPLLTAPPSTPSPPAPSSCPPTLHPAGEPQEFKCFTGGLVTPNSGDCFRAMHEILSGNEATDKIPLHFSTMHGVLDAMPLPWSWIQPGCIILIDASRPDNPADRDEQAVVVDTVSLVDIAVASQEIVQSCVIGGPRLGGMALVGENKLISLFVGRAPGKRKHPALVGVPLDDQSSDLVDYIADFCSYSLVA